MKPTRTGTPRRADITGNRYGALTVISFSHIKGRAAAWFCRCDCGLTTVQTIDRLNRGRIRSCERCVRQADIQSRIWDKIDKSDTCWLWTGFTNPDGYGRVSFDGKVRPAHCVVYELLIGPIKPGLELDHMCWVHSCVNPEHLRPATHQQNGENRLGVRNDSRSGIRGVVRSPYGWVAYYRKYGKMHYLGTHPTLEAANQVAIKARAQAMPYSQRDQLDTG